MESFTPTSSAIGGALIGLSTALLWAGNGRIAGISGIAGGMLPPRHGDWGWRAAFLAGLIAAPVLCALATGAAPISVVSASNGTIVVGGILVGVGTRLGGGCTSGHGVCGLARLSRRSMVATGTFMATAALVVFISRHLAGG